MAQDFATLVLSSDSRGLKQGRDELGRFTAAGERTENRVTRAMNGVGASFRAVAVQAAGMIAAYAGVGAALRGSQEIQQITNSLRALGMSTGEAEQALNSIAEIADRTRAPLGATAQLFQRVTIAGRDLGASQEDVLRFTENVGLALGATGISAQEASGALLQLSQAMAGGTVRAEEFNSILEGAFPIAQAAADGIDAAGGSVGRLRAMVIAGEVSSREFFEAVISQSDALQESFDATEQTIGQATTGLLNSFNLLARETDEAFGISSGIATGLEFLGDNLETVRAGVLGAAAVITGVYTPAIISATAATLRWAASLVTLRGALMATGIGALIVGAGVLIDSLFRLRSATGSWGDALGGVFSVAKEVFLGVGRTAWGLSEILAGVASGITGSFVRAFAEIAKSWDALVNGMSAAWNALADTSMGESMGLGRLGESDIGGTLGGLADGLFDNAVDSITRGGDRIREAGQGVADAMREVREIMNAEPETSEEAATQAQKLKEVLEAMGGEGGAAGKAAEGLSDADKEIQRLGDSSDRAADRFGNMIAGIVTGSQSASDALKQLGSNLISSGISGIASSLFKGSGLGDIFAGFLDGGGPVKAGQFAIAGERGPEIVTGPARVTSRADTARMMQGGGQAGGTTTIRLIAPEGFTAQQEGEARGIAVQVVQEASPGIVRRSVGATYERAKEVAIP